MLHRQFFLVLVLINVLIPPSNSLVAKRIQTNCKSGCRSSRNSPTHCSITTSLSSSTTPSTERQSTKKLAVLVCPAQFCVPDDYHVFVDNLRLHRPDVSTCKIAPLPRTEWIKVAKKLPTKQFFQAKLPVYSTLKWYFDAIENALADIFAEQGPDVNICMVGHSIGGWVARAYLGGLSKSSSSVYRLAMQQTTSLVTLGTPHVSPKNALVDQTRGLLNEIEAAESCQPRALAERGIDITCVVSNGIGGNFFTTNVEEIVAASSYLPLLGKLDGNVKGDGIVPLDLAFMDEPARRVIVEECSCTNLPVRHCHVVPTPWNLWDGSAPSMILPGTYPSYVSEGVLPQWAKYIQ